MILSLVALLVLGAPSTAQAGTPFLPMKRGEAYLKRFDRELVERSSRITAASIDNCYRQSRAKVNCRETNFMLGSDGEWECVNRVSASLDSHNHIHLRFGSVECEPLTQVEPSPSSEPPPGAPRIPNYENGTGYPVECADGEWSKSGGRPGACSHHGGIA